jgi:cardiolipin synthase A/B
VAYFLEHCIAVGSFLLAFVLLTDVFRKHRQPAGTMAWALAIVLIPYVGVPLYLLFGGRKIVRVRKRKADLLETELVTPESDYPPFCLADRALRTSIMPPPRGGHAMELHFNGEEAFHQLIDLLEGATSTIHITTFILGHDAVGRQIVDVLARKARDGIEVRLLLDSLGSLWTRRGFVRPLLEAGGEVGHFLPVLPVQRRWSANLRNHRKLVVVDNAAAMAGGMNLSTLFMGPEPCPERFLDASVFLRGPAVQDIQEIFLNDWQYATGHDQDLLAEKLAAPEAPGDRIVQVAASGPDVPEDIMHDALVCAITEAQERIWIVTPYFVPDEPLLKSLCLQARMGREVRLVIPRRSNHRIADWARRPALRRLHTAGAKIHTYPRGMIHAKLVVFDKFLAVSGSPNLDMRSMYLNFEIALFHYSPEEIMAIEAWIDSLAGESEDWEPPPSTLLNDWTEGLSKLISPLL